MHPDHQSYVRFTSRSRLEKSIHSLLGLLKGISLDLKINEGELHFLANWLSEHEVLEGLHPYNEIVPILRGALEDGVVSEEEREDLIWVCERLCSNKFYDEVTTGLQELHGLLGGVVADGVISEDELRGIQDWMDDNEQLRKRWPYDEIESLIITVLADGQIQIWLLPGDGGRYLNHSGTGAISGVLGRDVDPANINAGDLGLCRRLGLSLGNKDCCRNRRPPWIGTG
jgi:hypothetical protein